MNAAKVRACVEPASCMVSPGLQVGDGGDRGGPGGDQCPASLSGGGHQVCD